MACYNNGTTVRVGDAVRLPEGRVGTVTATSDAPGNEPSITVEIVEVARLLEPLPRPT